MAEDCLFCGIVSGQVPADVVLEGERTLAFRDIKPQAPVHVLVIPKRHVDNLEAIDALPDAVAKRLFAVASAVAEKLGVTEGGYAVRVNNGPDAGQEIFHLHLHVMGGQRLGMP